MEWNIRNIKMKNQIVIAPMAGLSDRAFRRLVNEMGAGLAYTEMISAEAIVRENKRTIEMLNGIEELDMPIGIQLFGENARTLAKAAKQIYKTYKNIFIDINMGCPVPKVAVSVQAGSALLKNPEKVYEIVEAVVNSVPIPVTVKIRSGWDEKNINAVEIAKICEQAGASAIAVHPRTRKQGYSGLSDWNIIKQVKEGVSIPVIGNGDVLSCYDAKRMLDETGCDAVMIGRGVLGNPWLIKDCIAYLEMGKEPEEISVKEKIDMVKKHLDYLLETKAYKVALLEIRSHAAWYLKGIPKGKELKQAIFSTKTKEEIIELLNEYEKSREII